MGINAKKTVAELSIVEAVSSLFCCIVTETVVRQNKLWRYSIDARITIIIILIVESFLCLKVRLDSRQEPN